MSRATPQMRDLSQRLIASEVRDNKLIKTTTAAAFQVCLKLGPHLGILMGNTGFKALLSRALALAIKEAPCLSSVNISTEGKLEGMDELQSQATPELAAEGSVILVAQLLGLLVAFIGENLTLRQLREVWPKLPSSG